MGLADSFRKLGVPRQRRYARDARTAIKFGGEGIGLCRTEHMFFEEETRIRTVREMILAEDEQTRPRRAFKNCCRCSAPISSSCSRS